MVHRQFWVWTLIVVLVFCSTQTHAQQDNSSTAKEQTAKAREKAFNLLESLASQVGSLQSTENRARIGSNLAGSLWKHDEERARALLALVEEDIKAGLRAAEDSEQTDTHLYLVFLKLRGDTAERIAKHDARAALAFFKATQPGSDKELPYEAAKAEHDLEMTLAKQIASDSPEIAVELGRKLLQQGLPNDILVLLRKVARKDKEQARILHKEIVQKLGEIDFPRDWNDTYFARILVASFMPPAADDSTFRDLINLFINNALERGCGGSLSQEDERFGYCVWFGSMFNLMEKADPARAAGLKRWAAQNQDLGTADQAYADLNDLTEGRTVDEVLSLESHYPELSGQIRRRALSIAIASGDTERARRIVSDFRGDLLTQESMLKQIERAQEWQALDDEKLAVLQNSLATIISVPHRVEVLLFAASQMAGSNQKIALKLVTQADDNVTIMKPGRAQLRAQFRVAMAYCLVKSDRGFAIMESFMPKLNELVDAAAKLDGVDTNYLRDGEWNMTGAGNLGDLLTLIAHNAGYFAWSDFDRAVNLAAQFDRNEIRIMAQLKLAQGILDGPPKATRGIGP